jgi:hypothetical protein
LLCLSLPAAPTRPATRQHFYISDSVPTVVKHLPTDDIFRIVKLLPQILMDLDVDWGVCVRACVRTWVGKGRWRLGGWIGGWVGCARQSARARTDGVGVVGAVLYTVALLVRCSAPWLVVAAPAAPA